MSAGFPEVCKMLLDRGEDIIEIEISEYAKIDGGLTCLSLRF
jgi:dimethylargininase